MLFVSFCSFSFSFSPFRFFLLSMAVLFAYRLRDNLIAAVIAVVDVIKLDR